MANTYTSLYYHIVFSTKNRMRYLKPEGKRRVWEYIGGVARAYRMTALQVGGVESGLVEVRFNRRYATEWACAVWLTVP